MNAGKQIILGHGKKNDTIETCKEEYVFLPFHVNDQLVKNNSPQKNESHWRVQQILVVELPLLRTQPKATCAEDQKLPGKHHGEKLGDKLSFIKEK
jgi:hypothetical protein